MTKQVLKSASCGQMISKEINGKIIVARNYNVQNVSFANVAKASNLGIQDQRTAFGNVADKVGKLIDSVKFEKYTEIAKFSDIQKDGKYMLDGVKFYAIVRKVVEPSGITRTNVAIFDPATGKTRMTGSITSLRKILEKIQAGK